ncbi:MAG: LytR C-terminal domain-containing protein [Actinobacteria bacterium]|nr:LytR C-terminal domain-containing protein [Actinomycetota bacterium]MCA1720851.1 LytR C-terminal domain-containing protein [Actinomycetota bacterium]
MSGDSLGDWHLPPVEPASAVLPEPASAPAPVPLDVPRRNPAQLEPVSPLRAMAGALVAVAGVLLGIGALLWATDAPGGDPTLTALNAQSSPTVAASLAPSPSAEPSQVPSPTVAVSSPAAVVAPTRAAVAAVPRLALTVLNNSKRPLLAERAARRFRAGGWPVKLTGNFTGRVTDTTVYYAPGQLRSAQLLQRSFAGLTRVRPRFAGLPGSGLTVVLTRSYDS